MFRFISITPVVTRNVHFSLKYHLFKKKNKTNLNTTHIHSPIGDDIVKPPNAGTATLNEFVPTKP